MPRDECNKNNHKAVSTFICIYDLFLCLLFYCVSEDNLIQIWNNGKGIPVEMHKEEKVYVPALIFGQLLTSSNYDDDERKVTGGRNGYGAKLCNIFSSEFTIETSCKESGRMFKQVGCACVYFLS